MRPISKEKEVFEREVVVAIGGARAYVLLENVEYADELLVSDLEF